MGNCSKALRKLTEKEILQDVINYLTFTKDEDWCVDVVRSKDQKKNCFLGHLFDFGGNLICDIFENGICNEYMYFEINDGTHPNYPQETPKLRVIAYLEDLKDGKEKTILQYMQDENNS